LLSTFVPTEPSNGAPLKASSIAPHVAQVLLFFSQSVSMVSVVTMVLRTVCDSSKTLLHTEEDLETLIGTLGPDERLIRTIVRLATPPIEIGSSGTRDLSTSFWNMLVQGLTSTVHDTLVEDALSSFDWERAQRTVLDRLHWFFFSPYADEAITSWLGKASLSVTQSYAFSPDNKAAT
jgi:hypothetical protein